MKLKTLLLITLLLCSAIVFAQQPQGQSRGNRSADEYIKLLESERRQSELQVAKVVEALKIKPGQHVADIGSGSGLFTRPLAKQTGAKGIVYAVDIDPELIKYVEKTAAEQKLTNIKTIMGGEADPKLPEKVDLIVIIDTLHHIANQPTYLKGLKKYLKSNGRIALIDFSKTWPAGHEKMVYKVEDLDGWMKAAGYKQIEKYDFLDNDFFVVYQ
ncbi:MAG TPA: methyltransferase domain-containing protein [Blastocatellia bacterium]|nr:methyltransferase domain-containing protein [Blastocatellia bacterium]